MSATISGAIKALLEGAGLGISVYRDNAPAEQTLPYVTVSEKVSLVPAFAGGDFGDANSARAVRELVDVHVWQQTRNPTTGAVAESYTLVEGIANALDGAVLASAPKHVHGVRLQNVVRLLQEDRIVHTVVSVYVDRHI